MVQVRICHGRNRRRRDVKVGRSSQVSVSQWAMPQAGLLDLEWAKCKSGSRSQQIYAMAGKLSDSEALNIVSIGSAQVWAGS